MQDFKSEPRSLGVKGTPLQGRLKNKKHTASRKKAGMLLNNWSNRTDLNSQFAKTFKPTLAPTL